MKKTLLLFALLLPFCIQAQLKINEIMSNNASAVMDDAYNYSMWVEIINSSATAVNQSSFYFTDNLNEPTKWKPVSKSIPAGGFSLLWFERDEMTGHSSFKLEPDGGTLFLLDANKNILDSVTYPKQLRNISYGRKTDKASEWTFFEKYSPGASNNGNLWSNVRCSKPIVKLPGGFYTTSQNLLFETPVAGDTIYYSLDGSEPTRKSTRYTPGTSIPLSLNSTRIVRAKTFSKEKLSSDVATSTYFVNTRNHHLPVVSIVTAPVNLTDNTIGIYVTGTNGCKGDNGATANFNQPWERPANYEFFDTTRTSCLNQELDIAITGAYSRTFDLKPLKIKPAKKFGDNRLRYNFFQESKPDLKYKDIMMRNSGNDFFCSMMRDGFHQTLPLHRMDIDLLAYQPAVLYLNGEYYGILNLREETGTGFMYSNFGLDSEDVTILDKKTIPTDARLAPLRDYIGNISNDITKPAVYDSICQLMDMDEFINYHIAEIFIANWDWPWNNVKMWKKTNGGKWRWLMYDTDWAFNYRDNQQNYNTLLYVLGEHPTDSRSDWSNFYIRRLKLNEKFCKTFVDRFCIQISSTFKTERVNAIMDSLSNKIDEEILFHKERWSGSDRTLAQDLVRMKEFSAKRPDAMMSFLSQRFANGAAIRTVNLTSNIPGASYQMNAEPIMDSNIKLNYFEGKEITLQTNPVFGYTFKQWELASSLNQELIKMGDSWNYFDGSAIPAENWFTETYSDASWKTAPAQFGWGDKEVTLLAYGDKSNKYPTAYFRKTVVISNPADMDEFTLKMYVDDGAVVYVNGTEIGRHLINAGPVGFNTYANAVNEGDYVTYTVPKSLLKAGNNLIAVEVHQANATSSDCVFDLQMIGSSSKVVSEVVTNPIFSKVLASNMILKAVFEKAEEIPDDKATVVINELVSDNTIFMDEHGVKEDYIELYNTGDQDVNIAGWYLSDTPGNRTLTQIPTTNVSQTIVPSKGRLMVWADGEPLQGLLHIGMKLSKSGETIILSRRNSFGNIVVVDSIDCPALQEDMSFSRIPDGGSLWSVATPTFNAKNGETVSIEEHPQSIIDIYPTLVSDYFTIRNAGGMLVTITDLTGKTSYKSMCESDAEIIPAQSMQKGMYLVTVGNQRFKIIKR